MHLRHSAKTFLKVCHLALPTSLLELHWYEDSIQDGGTSAIVFTDDSPIDKPSASHHQSHSGEGPSLTYVGLWSLRRAILRHGLRIGLPLLSQSP